MGHLPYMQFYPADWIQDTQVLSLEAQGAWIKILCALHVASERGRKMSDVRAWKHYLGYPDDDRAIYLLYELTNVADIEGRDENDNFVDRLEDAREITIISRRMVRDEAKRLEELERKRRYEVKNPTRHRRASDANPTRRDQRSDIRYKNKSLKKDSRQQPKAAVDDPVLFEQEKTPKPELTVKDLVESWNEWFAGKLPTVELPLAMSRHKKAAARLREHQNLDFWERVFEQIGASAFLMGRNNGAWRCTFDFLVTNDTNAIKIFEGSYNR